MPVAVTVQVEGAEEAREMLTNIDRHLPLIASNKMRKTANNVLEDLKLRMDRAFIAPRGNLRDRTRLEQKGFLEYNILMPKYGIYVDSGTFPHKVSKPHLFKPWQRKTGTRSLSTAIFLKGTKPKYFLMDVQYRDVPKRLNEFDNEFLAELRKKIKAKAKGGI